VGPLEGTCLCPPGTQDRLFLGTFWCSGGRIAAPEIRFNNDLDSLIIDFG